MKHYGDITQLHGYDLPVVDVITGGSPCQDLSVAGKRAGLDGERSGLFMEQIRIVKEMREKDGSTGRSGFLVRPRYLVWENVPGAFSSNGGEDFRVVLEEICKVADPSAVVPRPEKKWSSAGCILGDGFSVAWRVHDAQYWGATVYADGRMLERGTPQRRKRISLVADFGGLSAPEVLFERKGMSRNPEPRGEEGQGTAEGTEGCAGEPVPFEGNGSRESHRGDGYGESGDPSFTLNSIERHGVAFHLTQDPITNPEISPCISSGNPVGGQAAVGVAYGIDQQGGKGGANYSKDASPPILSDSHGTPHAVAYGIGSYESNAMKSSNPHSGIYKADTSRTLDLTGGSPACNQGGVAVVHAVDCRNGTEDPDTNGTLQAKSSGGFNTNSNNVVRQSTGS